MKRIHTIKKVMKFECNYNVFMSIKMKLFILKENDNEYI